MTLPDTPKWLLPGDGHLSLAQLRLYQEEELPAAARHQIEKHLLDCELCADVLAGMAVSNQMQTQAAVSQINRQLKNRVQLKQPKKVRPMYGPLLRVAAALVILLVSFGIFRYWQRSVPGPAPENRMAQKPPVNPESEPLATVTAPPDPVIKPVGPEPLAPVETKIRSQARKVTVPKKPGTSQPALAAASTAEETLFPIDTAAVLDAFAVKTADTPTLSENNPLLGIVGKNKAIAAPSSALAASVENKQMRLSLPKASTAASQTVSGKVLEAASVNTIPAKPEIGQKAFEHYIRQNLRYPTEARQQKQEGQVEVGFTVTTDGKLADFKIIKSLSPACDAEAIRLIKEGPSWQPRLLERGSSTQPEAETVQVTVPFKLE